MNDPITNRKNSKYKHYNYALRWIETCASVFIRQFGISIQSLRYFMFGNKKSIVFLCNEIYNKYY